MTNDKSTETTPARSNPLFVRSHRATGHGRLEVGDLARGELDGVPAHLVLPVEQVIAVDARTRMTGGQLNITVTGPDRLQDAARKAAEALCAQAGITGDIRLTIRPLATGHAAGHTEATAAATLNAIAKAEELPMAPTRRSALVRQAGLGDGALSVGSPALVGEDGTILASLPEHGRVLLVVATPRGKVGDDEAAGPVEMSAPTGDMSDPVMFAAWLAQVSGPHRSAAGQVMADALAHSGLPGHVIGGRTEHAPVAVVLPVGNEHLLALQQFSGRVRPVLAALDPKADWRTELFQSAAHTALQ